MRGALDARAEIVSRVARAWEAGRVSDEAPAGAAAQRGSVYVRDLERPDVVFVCLHDRPRGELVVITLWEEGEDPAVPREFTDALRNPVSSSRPRKLGRPGRR